MSDDERDPDQRVLPQLRYARPIEAIDWLVRVFGFTEDTRMSGPNGELYISVLLAPGGGTVMVCGPLPDHELARLRGLDPPAREGDGPGRLDLAASLTVMVPDVDAHHERSAAEGARILGPPMTQPWGLRDYEVLDLEDRQWNFSQRVREVVPEDWGADRVE